MFLHSHGRDDKKSNPIQDKKILVVIFCLRNLNYPFSGGGWDKKNMLSQKEVYIMQKMFGKNNENFILLAIHVSTYLL